MKKKDAEEIFRFHREFMRRDPGNPLTSRRGGCQSHSLFYLPVTLDINNIIS